MPLDLDIDEGRKNYLINFSKKYKYIYVEVPKTGCTTIKRALQLAEFDGDDSQLSKNIHDRRASPLLAPRQDPEAFASAWEDPEYVKFTFVRNPYTRTLSAYLDKIVINEWERERRLPALGFDSDSTVGFAEFLERIADQNPREMDIHWAPQHLLIGAGRNRYDRIFRFEAFREAATRVFAELGIDGVEGIVESLPHHATGAGDKLREHYGETEQQLVASIFSEDFERLGYHVGLDRAA